MDPLRSIRAGDPIRMSASTTNAMLEAARKAKMSGRGFRQDLQDVEPAQIFIKAHKDLERFKPVALGTCATPISDNGQFQKEAVFNGEDATGSEPFAVTLVPIKSGQIGRAIVFGIVPCVVTVSKADHEYAVASSSGGMESATNGHARIVWMQPEPPISETHASGDPWDAWCLLSVGVSDVEDDLPYGYVRIYRGTLATDVKVGEWIYAGTPVLDDDTENTRLGFEASTTKVGTLGFLAIPQSDLPDPYEHVLPDGIANRDRTDYCIASIAGPSLLHAGSGPFVVPASETGGGIGTFTDQTLAQLHALLAVSSPSTLQTWQRSNVWRTVGDGQYIVKVDVSRDLVPGIGIDITDTNQVRLAANPPANVPSGKQVALLCTAGTGDSGGPSFNFGEIASGTGGGVSGVTSSTPSVVVAEDGSAVTVGLDGDSADAEGVYYADGELGRTFVPISGSIKMTATPEIQLQGDSDLSGTTDKLVYIHDRTLSTPASRWAKIGTNGGLEVSTTAGALGLRLKGSTDTAPSANRVYGTDASGNLGWIECLVVLMDGT